MNIPNNKKIELLIQPLVEMVPVIGPFISNSYFGFKNEKRLLRLESFYAEIMITLQTKNMQLNTVPHDPELLLSIIERLNNELEVESHEQKIKLFKNYFLNILSSPTTSDTYDTHLIYFYTLKQMTYLDFVVLTHHFNQVDTTDYIDIEPHIKGACNHKLESLGLLSASYSGPTMTGTTTIYKTLLISEFGKKIIKYCTI